MKLRLRELGTLTGLVIAIFGILGLASAHPVTVDGNPTEWIGLGVGPNEDNIGHVVRSADGRGQFIWADETLDQRMIAGQLITQTREVDMREVRVTGDAANLSVYVSLASVTQVDAAQPGVDLPQIQIAIDTAAGGTAALVAPASSASVAAPWEYLIRTDFAGSNSALSLDRKTNTAPPLVYSNATTSAPKGTASVSGLTNAVEIQVPWADIGGFPTGPLHFTVATLRSSGVSPTDATPTNIFDTLSPIEPAAIPIEGLANTQDELANSRLDYAFTVNFDQLVPVSSPAAGEPYSPLLVTEVGLYPTVGVSPEGSSQAQWIEITNVSGATLDAARVSGYKIGDAPQRISNEAMRQLPSVAIPAGQSIIITRNKTTFQSAYPAVPAAQVYQSGALTAMTGVWGGAADISLRATGLLTETIYDQIVLLDDSNTVADLVEYTSAALVSPNPPYPDHAPVMVPFVTVGSNNQLVPNTSIQRCPTARDTNNRDSANPDWLVTTSKAEQTPLARCPVADVGAAITGPQSIVIDVTQPAERQYTITYGNSRSDAAAAGVVLTDILPIGMQYKPGSTVGTPAVGEPTVTTLPSGRTQLVWNIGTVAAGAATQTIAFTTSLPTTTVADTSAHDVTISTTTREMPYEQANNAASLAVTYTTEPVVDVAVAQSIVEADSARFPGGRIVYRVNYYNFGTKDATGITLIDAFPAGLTYLGNSANFAADTSVPGQVTLTLPGVLVAGSTSGTVDIIFRISDTLTSNDTIAPNTVTIATTTTPEAVTNNNTVQSSTAEIDEPPALADLLVTTVVKDASNARPGGSIVYTVSYANVGSQAAANVTLENVFSSSLVYQSNSQQLTPSQSSAGQVSFTLAPLAAGATGSIDITFRIKTDTALGTPVTNKSTIATTSTEASLTNNTSLSPETTVVRGDSVIYLPIVQR